MLVGIISDSHDNFADVLRALKHFEERRVGLILHAGDVIGSGMCYAFEGCSADVKLVYGNNDGDRLALQSDFEGVGAEHLGDFGDLEVDGLRVALLHGTHEPLVRALVNSGDYDVVIRGHNHTWAVEEGETLLINPGEVWGHLTGYRSAAILNTATLEVERIDLGRETPIRDLLALEGLRRDGA